MFPFNIFREDIRLIHIYFSLSILFEGIDLGGIFIFIDVKCFFVDFLLYYGRFNCYLSMI